MVPSFSFSFRAVKLLSVYSLDVMMEGNATLPSFSANHSHTGNCSRDNLLKTVVFPVLYSVLFLLGLSLNAMAAWVFFSIPSKSHFIIYLKNIVVADILMTLTFPFKVR